MKELLEHIISSLIDEKYYEIEENVDGDNIRFILKVDQEFIGMIIGKGGKTVKSIRNILRIKAVLENKGVFLEVVEKEEKKDTTE
ncbi:KH domain-containing protein [Candidatus Woesebacteria bacterium]|nr:KH domain-containing protein [Candidatus Woesebacteria bacterium]